MKLNKVNEVRDMKNKKAKIRDGHNRFTLFKLGESWVMLSQYGESKKVKDYPYVEDALNRKDEEPLKMLCKLNGWVIHDYSRVAKEYLGLSSYTYGKLLWTKIKEQK